MCDDVNSVLSTLTMCDLQADHTGGKFCRWRQGNIIGYILQVETTRLFASDL